MGVSVGGAPAYARIRLAFERGEPLTPWHYGVLAEANDRCLDALAPLLAGPVAPRRASSTLGMTVTDVIVAGTEEERERFMALVKQARRDNEEVR